MWPSSSFGARYHFSSGTRPADSRCPNGVGGPETTAGVPCCGPKLELLSWLSPWGRVTARLAESIARMRQHMAVKHVASYFDLGWDRSSESFSKSTRLGARP
jgi:hypothetical protein